MSCSLVFSSYQEFHMVAAYNQKTRETGVGIPYKDFAT